MRTLVVALAVILLMGALPSAAGPSLDTWAAGRSIGRIRIGMHMSDAAIALRAMGGDIEHVEKAAERSICHIGVGVCVFDFYAYGADDDAVRTPGRVLAISTDDPRYKEAGLGIGSPIGSFTARYGAVEFTVGRWLEWMSRGLAVVSRGNQVFILWVFKPRQTR